MKKWLLALMVLGLLAYGFNLWRERKWDGKTRFTLVDLKSPVTVFSFDPATGGGIRMILPDNLLIDTVQGHGGLVAGVMDKASRQSGPEWAADSVGDYLGITFTGISGRLGLWDRLMWGWNYRQVEWKTINLAETTLLTDIKDPDGVVVSRLAENWPQKAEEWFSSVNLTREQVNVNIVNSTSIGGLGAHVARIIENGGIRVVGVTNSNTTERVEKCRIEGNKEAYLSLTGKWLLKQFDCEWVNTAGQSQEVTVTVGWKYKEGWLGN